MKNIAKLGKPSLIFGFGQEKRLNLIKKYIDLKGKNIFGNIPLVNWLPLKIRNIFCPHVRVYTSRTLKQLFALTEF